MEHEEPQVEEADGRDGGDDANRLPTIAGATTPRTQPKSQKNGADDVAFLSARLRKLRYEEQKEWKHLESARRALELTETARKRRFEAEELRQQKLKEQKEAETRQRQALQENREAQRHALFLSRSKMSLERRKKCSDQRAESQYNQAAVRDEREARLYHHMDKHDLVMEMKEKSLAKREAFHESVAGSARRQRADNEEQISQERAKNVAAAAAMLTEEAQIMHRLQQLKEATRTTMDCLNNTVRSQTPRK